VERMPRPFAAARVTAWLGELARVPRGVIEAYVPGTGGVGARAREQLMLAATGGSSAPLPQWIHDGWMAFLGPREVDDALLPLFDYAEACAATGGPLDTTVLSATYPAAVVRSTRATVAHAALVDLVLTAASGLTDRARGRPGLPAPEVPAALVTAVAGLPVVAPLVAVTALLRVVDALVGPLPPVERVPAGGDGDVPAAADAVLAADLVAAAVPSYLGHALVRLTLVRAPFRTAVGIRMDETVATLWVGRGRLTVEPGLHPEAVGVLDGGLDPVLRAVAASIVRDLAPGPGER
jgi:hypothetical protein